MIVAKVVDPADAGKAVQMIEIIRELRRRGFGPERLERFGHNQQWVPREAR